MVRVPIPTLASDTAYEALRREICTLRFPPGSVLNEAAVMQQLNVGRTPLREAIKRLVLDRLVVVLPRQGTLVSQVSIQDLQEIFEVRCTLEGVSARHAAERSSPADLERIAHILQHMQQSVMESNYEGLIQLDQDFHGCIAAMSRNSYLVELLDRLNNQSIRFWYLSFMQVGRLDETMAEHQQIYEAIADRNGEAAETYMRRHVEEFKKKVLQTL